MDTYHILVFCSSVDRMLHSVDGPLLMHFFHLLTVVDNAAIYQYISHRSWDFVNSLMKNKSVVCDLVKSNCSAFRALNWNSCRRNDTLGELLLLLLHENNPRMPKPDVGQIVFFCNNTDSKTLETSIFF